MSDDVKLTKAQQDAINHDKGNLLVSASAGSGKTHVIIERIIRLVKDKGVSVDKILAVTFTKLAAEEMKVKLKSALISEYNKTGELYLKEQIKLVSISDISTIHSFLANLLRTYFYAINLDATFEVLDDRRSEKLASKALDELFEELYEGADEDFIKLLSYYSSNRRDDKLKKLVKNVYEFAGAEESLESLEEKSIAFQSEVYNVKLKGDLKLNDGHLNSNVETIKMIISLTKKFKEKYFQLKQEENGIDFLDIEFLSLRLFENEDILNEIKNKYEYIFIDEYQDVNRVQENIICKLQNDNLFMVGDSKQSIYAFRGCNPAFFIEKADKYSQKLGGEAIFLDKNFRSANAVVKGVNQIFSSIMTKEFGSYDYANHQMLYGEGYREYEGRAVMHLIEEEESQGNGFLDGVYSVVKNSNGNTQVYGNDVLAVVKTIKDVLGKQYYDIKSKAYKKIGYGDICVLARYISNFGEKLLKALLDFNIPVSAGLKNKISSYPEIKALYSAVKAICFMQSDVDLATVMLNFYGFSENELMLIRACGDRCETFYSCLLKAVGGDYKISAKAKSFYDWFNGIRLMAEYMPASEVLKKLIADGEWELKLLSSQNGKSKALRVERFIQEADFTAKPMSIYEFCEYLEDAIDNITIAETESEGTVNILTAHGSKGLEFPIVIVANTATKFSYEDVKKGVYMSRECGIVPKTYNLDNMTVIDNVAYKIAKDTFKPQRSVEEIRLLYVQLTRAKCELHVIASEKQVQINHLGERYKGAVTQCDFFTFDDLEKDYYKTSLLKSLTPEKDDVATVAGNLVESDVVSEIKENLSYVYPNLNDVTLPLKSSVTRENGSEEYYKITNAFGDSSSEMGTSYHRFLELTSFDSEKVDLELDNFIQNSLISSKEAQLLDKNKLKAILSMPIFKQIKDKKVYREKKFCYLVEASELGYSSNEKILIQGIIDLIIEDESGVTLVDYKLSKIESDEDLVKKYYKQLSLYKNAIEGCMGVKVNKAMIINILQEKIIEVEGI